MKINNKNKIYITLSIGLFLLLWQGLSMSVNDSFLFPKPLDVLTNVFFVFKKPFFLNRLFNSISNIVLGVFISYICSIIFSFLSIKFNFINIILKPYIAIIKSTPVASFIILCLIFLPISRLSMFISFLMSFPIVYENLYFAILSVDKSIIEMANVFNIKGLKRLLYIYLPHLEPTLLSISKLSISLSFKAGFAAEVIGIPTNTIGELLYQSKIYMDTKELLALTVVIVLSSFIIEFILKNLIILFFKNLYK